jgi:hypothetical protein
VFAVKRLCGQIFYTKIEKYARKNSMKVQFFLLAKGEKTSGRGQATPPMPADMELRC